jgi:low affinity Fe/Cu permease
MQQRVEITSFYDALKDISIINRTLEDKRQLLKKHIDDYNTKVQNFSINKKLSSKNKELDNLLEETLNVIKYTSSEWIKKFEEMLEKEKFRSDLENYFIIIIFGKVKAGKSSLGNFVAKQRPKDEKVDFFKYDEAGKEKSIPKLKEIDNEDGFATNNLECTTEIQGFKLGGMAWIDTPGLGSMVEENGELAKQYIQSADYIIYPTSSNSPLQNDEISQLKELFEQNKKVTICITKSDTTEEDECECGDEEGCSNCDGGIVNKLVNKSHNAREQQEVYVKGEIEKTLIKDKESVLGDIFSISTHTAQKALEQNNESFFEESNIPKFYELMEDVVTKKAKTLKENTPYDGLKSFINNDLLGESQKVKQEITNFDKVIDENIKKFDNLIFNVESDLENEIESIIAEYYHKIDKDNSKETFKEIDKNIDTNIAKMLDENIKSAFEDFGSSLNSLVVTSNKDEFEIDDIYERYEYTTVTRNKKIGAALLGGAATIGAGLLTGGGAWVAAGAAIASGTAGGYLGGKLGEMTGEKHSGTVNVGDNKNEVLQLFKENRVKVHNENIKKVYQQIKTSFFTPMQDVSQEMKTNLKQLEKKLTQLI